MRPDNSERRWIHRTQRRRWNRPWRSSVALGATLISPLLIHGVRSEILLVSSGDDAAHEYEAIIANWNQAIDDTGQWSNFAGTLRFDAGNPGGCASIPSGTFSVDAPGQSGVLVLIDAAQACDELPSVTDKVAEAGAAGVIFFYPSDEGLAGIALGNREAPRIRAVMIERRHGEAIRDATTAMKVVNAELRKGRLISEEAYEEQFIFRADEIASTRRVNFLWHRYPEMLQSLGHKTLSAKLMESNFTIPPGWFSRPPGFVPLFNPSLLSLKDGSMLAALRMSNGPGCPSVRHSRESSMDTRIFRNELVLAHIDSADFSISSHVLVETPELSCHFTESTKTSGRKFLDSVHGPMDARITAGVDDTIWVTFFAERNAAEGDEVERGMHAAPLHVSWRKCQDAPDDGWRLQNSGAILSGPSCQWLGSGNAASADHCRVSCDDAIHCNAVNFRAAGGSEGRCEMRVCGGSEEATALAGWEAWRRGQDPDPAKARSQIWPRRRCLHRAWIEPYELIAFPAMNDLEKNWNLIVAEPERLIIEYHIEPHIVLEVNLNRHSDTNKLAATSMTFSSISRWPYEVMHGISNVRGGYCCLKLPERQLQRHLSEISLRRINQKLEEHQEGDGHSVLPEGPLLLGVGHLQRIRSPFDQAPGDVSRFRRQAQSRAYHQFFYLLRGTEPFDVVAVSPEWCITMNGHFSQHWKQVLSQGEEACEAIQFVAGLAMRGKDEVVVAYGINDCESDLLPLPLTRVLSMLRPVNSKLNVSLDDLEMI